MNDLTLTQENTLSSTYPLNHGTTAKLILPLEMRWDPTKDITTYELAKCLPYMLRLCAVMPYEIDKSEIHFRHFKIIDHSGLTCNPIVGSI